MRTKLFLAFALVALFSSCEDVLTDPTSAEIAAGIEGQWSVDENSSLYKSTLQSYTAYIEVSEFDSTAIHIWDFYGLGDDVASKATVMGYSISLTPNQSLSGGYTLITGSGTISKNLKEITWSYSIDDGSGVPDNVNATYTFLY